MESAVGSSVHVALDNRRIYAESVGVLCLGVAGLCEYLLESCVVQGRGFLPPMQECEIRGVVYMINLMHGDCRTEVRQALQWLDGRSAVIVTDPPFNVGYHYNEYKDKKPEEEYVADLLAVTNNLPVVMIHYPEFLHRFSIALGKVPDRVVSWVYNSNTPRQHRDIAYWGLKPIFDGLGEYKNPTDKRIAKRIAEGKKAKGYDWLYCDQIKNISEEKTAHPCQMPLEVMLYIVRTIPNEYAIIDPFMGSGTTILAAKIVGRDAVGIELSEEYYNIASKRIENDMPLFKMAI